MASLASLTGDQQLLDARKSLSLLDLVELGVHPLQELLPRQERLDVEGPQEVPGRAAGHPLREPGSGQHAGQRIDEQRQAEALVRRVRVPSGASSPPSSSSPGSVIGRPARSNMIPSGIGVPCWAATRTFCIELTVVAMSRTTGGWRRAGRP